MVMMRKVMMNIIILTMVVMFFAILIRLTPVEYGKPYGKPCGGVKVMPCGGARAMASGGDEWLPALFPRRREVLGP